MEATLLQSIPGPLDTQVGRIFLALLVVAAILLVGRVVLSVAWKLVVIAAVVVGAILVLGLLGVV